MEIITGKQKSQNVRIRGYVSSWITKCNESECDRNIWDCVTIRSCGLVLWVVPPDLSIVEVHAKQHSGDCSCLSGTKALERQNAQNHVHILIMSMRMVHVDLVQLAVTVLW